MTDVLYPLVFAVDTGILVLIWLVQLVIYPGLAHMNSKNLHGWHSKYTRNVSFVVMPLMLSQLIGVGLEIIYHFNSIILIKALCITFAFGITFFKAVQEHQKIQFSSTPMMHIRRLIHLNWPRTIAWTIAWLLGLFSLIGCHTP